MADRIDIHEPIFEICRRLDLKPEFVKEIVFREHDGAKYVVPLGSDSDRRVAATEQREFEVTT